MPLSKSQHDFPILKFFYEKNHFCFILILNGNTNTDTHTNEFFGMVYLVSIIFICFFPQSPITCRSSTWTNYYDILQRTFPRNKITRQTSFQLGSQYSGRPKLWFLQQWSGLVARHDIGYDVGDRELRHDGIASRKLC